MYFRSNSNSATVHEFYLYNVSSIFSEIFVLDFDQSIEVLKKCMEAIQWKVMRLLSYMSSFILSGTVARHKVLRSYEYTNLKLVLYWRSYFHSYCWEQKGKPCDILAFLDLVSSNFVMLVMIFETCLQQIYTSELTIFYSLCKVVTSSLHYGFEIFYNLNNLSGIQYKPVT